VTLRIPQRLRATCRQTSALSAWLEQLPATIRHLQARWSLVLEAPFDGHEGSCAWVAPATRSDGTPVVLKVGMPHWEGEHEIAGLRFWNGDPTVQLLAADDALGAMLLERCEGGMALRQLPEEEQDVVIAGLLRRLWRKPTLPHPFRPLAAMTAYWAHEARARAGQWPDVGLVQAGLRLFEELPRSTAAAVVLATDLHAGNVLQAQREPWLVIDPKPFVGDPAYDATQHLLNCPQRMHTHPHATLRRFADLLQVDDERVRWWMFARVAVALSDRWDDASVALARGLAQRLG
jgi:streptomycin 6-kinase